MRQQVFEAALKAILAEIEKIGATNTHDTYGDRKKLNQMAARIAQIAREALHRG
jgi:HEPN domain-containing protein